MFVQTNRQKSKQKLLLLYLKKRLFSLFIRKKDSFLGLKGRSRLGDNLENWFLLFI